MEHTNAYKLSAIVAKWLEPMAGQLAGMKLSSFPALANIENKIKSSGWVGSGYTIANDLSPILSQIINSMIQPVIHGMVKDLPDEAIPKMFHNIVNAAIENGGLTLLDGKVSFSGDDMVHLSRLLDRNLPCDESEFIVED